MVDHKFVKEILFNEKEIQKRIKELAIEIQDTYKDIDQPLILIAILRGCIFFLTDFMKQLDIECSLDCMYVESYSGKTTASIEPRIKMDILSDIKDRHVLIVEDIIDSGKTLVKIVEHLKEKSPKSVKIVTLLDKKVKRSAKIEADWFGFEVPDHFLIGYGLDYNEILRNLPYVAIADIDKINEYEATK